jgi:hypothetical protein
MPTFRMSLREMLILVALVAMGICSLKYANDTWLPLVAGVTMIAIFIALIIAFVDRGPRQAFAIGFVLVALSYGYVVLNSSIKVLQSNLNPEMSFGFNRLPTTWLLRYAYQAMESGYWHDSETGKKLPSFDPRKQSQRLKIVGNRGVPIDEFVEVPPQEKFIRIGQMWWAIVLGYAGGIFAKFVYWRRLRDEQKLPAESS